MRSRAELALEVGPFWRPRHRPQQLGKVLIVAPKKGSGLGNYLGGQTQTSSVVLPRKGDLLQSHAQRLPCRWWRWAWAVQVTA